MHRQMGIAIRVEEIPSGKHQRDLQGPPQLCVCPPKAWNPAAASCTPTWKTSHRSVSALHFLVASALPDGFCKVFPVDLAGGLCWHVAKSVQNITICWLQPRLSFVFVWTLKKKNLVFFFPTRGRREEADEGKNIDRVKNIEYYFCFKDRNLWGCDAFW